MFGGYHSMRNCIKGPQCRKVENPVADRHATETKFFAEKGTTMRNYNKEGITTRKRHMQAILYISF